MVDFTKLVEFLKIIPPELVFMILDDLPTQYLDIFRQQKVHPLLLDYMIEERFLGYKSSPVMMERRDFANMNKPKYHTFEYQPRVKTPTTIYNDEASPKIPINECGVIAIDVISQEYIDELHERQVQYAEKTHDITRFDLTDNPRDQFYYVSSKLPRHSYFDSIYSPGWNGVETKFTKIAYENMLEQYYTKEYDVRDYQKGVFGSEVAAGMCNIIAEPEDQPITNAIDESTMAKNYSITTEITVDGQAQPHTYGEYYPKHLGLSKKEIKELRKTLNEDQVMDIKWKIESMSQHSLAWDGFVLNRPRNILDDLQRTSAESAKIHDNGDGIVEPFCQLPFTGSWWWHSNITEYSKEDLEEAEREYDRYFSENAKDLMKYIRV